MESVTNSHASGRPDRIILVYSGESSVRAMLADILKKSVGREDCALCEITYGPLGKRKTWRACEARFGLIVDELHRDQLPEAWALSTDAVPCILGRVGAGLPFVLIAKQEIEGCGSRLDALEERIRVALAARGAGL